MSTRTRRRTMRPHRLDHVSLFFGLVFTMMGAAGLISGSLPRTTDLRTILGVLGVTGGLVVLSALIGGLRPRPAAADPSPPPQPLPTPEQVRVEDQQWLGMAGPLSDVEREVLAALEDEDR